MAVKCSKVSSGFVFVVAGVLAACSNPQGSGSAGTVLKGAFVDHPVEGLAYATATQAGLLDRQGAFRYRAGEAVSFRLGDVDLGSAAASGVLTPRDLGAPRAATNIARLLQTLDADCFAANGILIPQRAIVAAQGVEIDFDQAADAFAQDDAVEALVAAGRSDCPGLIGAAAADATLDQTIEYMAANGGQPNRLPDATASGPETAAPGATVALVGTASDDDGEIVSIQWTELGDAPALTLSNASSLRASFVAPRLAAARTFTLRLRVTDDAGGVADATVRVTVTPDTTANVPPTASAGLDRAVNEGAAVTLDGVATDADGSVVSMTWAQDAGDTLRVTLAGADTASASFTAPAVSEATELHFTFTAVDDDGESASDSVTVTVNDVPPDNLPPVAAAGEDRLALPGSLVQLDGSDSADSDGSIVSHAWSQVAGPAVDLLNADGARASFTAPALDSGANLVFRLTVTDDRGATAADDVAVRVRGLQFVSVSGGEVLEGDSGARALGFTISLAQAASEPVTVGYSTQAGTASAGADYTAAQGSVSFLPGDTQKSVTVDVLGDRLDENDETFLLLLADTGGLDRGNDSAAGLIRDDDQFLFQVGTGEASHDPTGKVCFGSGSMCSRSADPSADGEDAFRKNALGGYDHLISKATAITGANGETFILVTTTNIGYFLAYKPEQHGFNGIYDVRLRIARATGVPSTNIVVVSDHSHNGPDTIGIWGGVSAEYMKITADAVVNSAVAAFESRRPATLRAASVNGNAARLPGIPALDSSYDLPPGNDPARGNPYNEFRLMTADDAATGERILTFVNYAPHATVTNGDTFDGKYKLTGDWTAWAPQETERRFGGMGLAAIGTVGGTDWNKSGDIPAKEAEARARLNRLIDAATARLQPLGSDVVGVESTFIREPMAQPILLLNYKPGLDRNTGDLPQDGRDLRIDRAVNPPFLTGAVVGTYVSAIRIGDVFISTFPGEPFGELDQAIKEQGRVLGAREYFLLGGANDFFGYMVKNRETYEQTLATGALWLAGCPDEDFAKQAGYREEGEGACSDHWSLMVSPTIGSHIVCTLQDSADRLGFETDNHDPECAALTALDGRAPPPESGDPLADNPALAREAAVTAARALAAECAGAGAPAELCAALDEGAKQAAILAGANAAAPTPPADGQARAGVAIKDASWHLGASAGQFAATGVGVARDMGFDPYGHSVRKVGSDTLGTRITTRALVVEGRNGKRVAVVSNDLYLPNDLLHRRTSQLLAEHDLRAALGGGAVTGITDQNLSTTSSHSHTSPFYSTPGWGTWIFQDVMDLRFYEYMARQMADAVIEAAARLVPVRMGGATVKSNDVQAHTYGPKVGQDGTPAGQPRDYTTQALTIVSFEDISGGAAAARPLANWVIFGVHPEWVWGEEVVNGDITHAVMRMLDRETGAVTLWSQRETGSSGPHKDNRVHPPRKRHEFQESNFSGYDRAARLLTDAALRALDLIDRGTPENTPHGRSQFAGWQTGFEVDFASQRVSPPATRPYPGVANCNTEPLFEGHVGLPIVPEPPECGTETDAATQPLFGSLPVNPLTEVAAQLRQAGVPVPDSYGITSFTGVQETMAVHLQVFKLGRIAATMSPNEQFTSQALNLESRLDRVAGNVWNGFDWACVAQARGQFPADAEGSEPARHCALQNERYPEDGSGDTTVPAIPGDLSAPGMARARAQIHNDATGWELDPAAGDPAAIGTLGGEAEPADITQIKGNFTREEFTTHGYDLVVAVGMANDYWGYMAEYREFRAHSDPYRKGLNALGPHGADFVATRLARMAANLNGAGVALPVNPFDTPYQAESQRADATARTLGQAAQAYTAAYEATLPPDGGVPEVRVQPAAEVKRFGAATLQFVGGSNWTDLPQVRMERFVPGGGGRWVTYGTQEGEVQLQLRFLPGLPLPPASSPLGDASFSLPDPQALAQWRAGEFEWLWTASFEAFVSELDDLGARPGITPAGKYRFVAEGRHRSTPGVSEYRLVSDTFEVVPWDGITVESLQFDADNRLSFQVGPINTVTRFRRGLATDAGSIDVVPGLVVGPIDYPDSYDGGLGWIRNERQLAAGDEQYCARCSFRPWADTAAVAVNRIPVTVERRGAQGQVLATRTLFATPGTNGRWITDGVIEDGETAFVPARVIVDEYGERNGAASAGVTRDDSIPRDRDGDGVPDAADVCPTVPGTGADGCPVPPPPPLRDTDGDGVIDAVDRCATRAGPAERAGCPDDTPSLADACDAFGVDEASPLCGGLRDAADEFRGQCEDFGGPAELCVLSTGNLHTLVDACYANAGAAPLCRAVDAFTGGAAAACRAAARDGGQPPELCALVDGVAVSEAALQRYEASWVHRALTLQNRLGYGQRLLDSVLLHTHNSFNAPGENRPQTLSGSDYNQLYGVHDQLRMGIRAIELDVHWMPGAGGSVETQGFEPKLCHGYTSGGAPHVGCTTEEPLGPVLADIRAWLDANPGEVIALYLEDHFTETAPDVAVAYAETSRVLQAELGARIWRSGLGCDNSDPVAWLRKTRDEIRAAGAQVLIFGESCDDTGSAWNSMVHVKKDANIHQGTQSSYEGLSSPSCQLPGEAAFITGSRGLRWTRVWEDSTLVSNVAGRGVSPASITPEVMRELARCGLNLPGLDRLHPADGRLEAAIWSWAANEPVASATQNCAMQDAEGRFVAVACGTSRAYACVSTSSASDWRVTGQGPWNGGATACPAGYRFSVPATGYQNERLRAARPQGTDSVWLNYTDAAAEGVWTGDAVAAPGGPPREEEPGADALMQLLDKIAAGLESLAANVGGTLAAMQQELSGLAAAVLADPASALVQLQAAAERLQSQLGVIDPANPWTSRRVLNISHRGGEQDWPENTMFAYAESIRVAGSNMIEMDIYESLDGELMVIHDATVNRTTNGAGDVSSFTVAQLQALDAAHWFAQDGDTRYGTSAGRPESFYVYRGIATGARPAPAGYRAEDFRIPTLRQIFENPRFDDVFINIELKPDPDSTGQYEAKLAALIREYGRQDDVMVASFLDHNLTLFKANAPEIATAAATVQVAAAKAAGNPPFVPADTHPGNGLTVAHKAFQVPPDFSGIPVVDREFIADAHARGIAVHAWTINDRAQMVQLLNWCVDGIMSDRPRLLAEVLASDEWHCPLDPPRSGAGPRHFIGSIHEHSGYSDGEIGTTPADYFAAGLAQRLDFMAGTEHSDNARLPVTANTDCASDRFAECVNTPPDGLQKWGATARIADAIDAPGRFTAIRGFEWTSDRFGHINVLFSRNDLNAKTSTGYSASMEDFWQWLALAPEAGGGADGLAVFNHPGREDSVHGPLSESPVGGDPAYAWNDFAYRAEHDARMVGIEMYGKGSDYYDGDNGAPPGGWFAYALDRGWHLAPVGAEDEHGREWAKPARAKTVIIASANTRAALREAMQARRMYALAHGHGDVRIDYSAAGAPMGSRLVRAAGATVEFAVDVRDLDPANGIAAARIEAVGPGGDVVGSASGRRLAFTATAAAREAWRFVRVLDAGGRVIAVSAPIWFGAGEAGGPGEPGAGSGPCLGGLCLSQIPLLGKPLADALAPLLGGGDPTEALAAAVDPAIAQCRDVGMPESLCARAEDVAGGAGLSRYVEPRIGSVAPGFTNPGPQLPFGMVAAGPDTEGPLNYGGYYIHNALISGFSQVHMSAGVYKGGYFPLLPFTGEFVNELNAAPGPSDHPMPAYASGFEHATETADAGYYAVTLARYGVLAELTATERVALHRYTFPASNPVQPTRVLLDASRTLGGYRPAEVTRRDAATLSGRLLADRGFPVFFALRASEPYAVTTFSGAALAAGDSTGESSSTGVVLDFADAPSQVTVKIALSYTDEAGAVANLAEIPTFDFAATREAARAKWDAVLGRVQVQGGTVAERVSFYSAIYRAMQFPNLHSDIDGRYRGPDDRIRDDDSRPHYSQFSSWDSYRGQNQLQAELFPAEYGDMIRSLLDFHDQAGYLPRWQEGSKDSSHMSGDPIIPFIGEAWCRGQIAEPALRNRLWNAMQILVDRRDDELEDLGYLAVPGPQPFFDASPLGPLNDVQRVVAQLPEIGDGTGRAGTTLEYGIADFALALMAQGRAPAGVVQDIVLRSQNYRNLIDTAKAPADRWIQPRLASGDWSPNFLPESGYGFQEGTSWQYSWLAMHDYAGLFELMGGDAAVQQRLDTFFNLPAVLATPVAWPAAQNQITAFGVLYLGNQFAPGNEHDVQAPYAYAYAGAPWKAQAVARAAASIYTPLPNGLPGNDDLGALSGWLVWTMAGLYPMNPGSPVAVVGSPHFERVTFKRPGGDLVIEAPGASPVNKYVQALRIDGAESTRPWLALPRGHSTVRMEMGPIPATAFGTAATDRPPSVSSSPLAQFACTTGAQ